MHTWNAFSCCLLVIPALENRLFPQKWSLSGRREVPLGEFYYIMFKSGGAASLGRGWLRKGLWITSEAQTILSFSGGSGTSTHSETGTQKVCLVFYLGGVTYAEIAALRFLSQQEESEYPHHICNCTVSAKELEQTFWFVMSTSN